MRRTPLWDNPTIPRPIADAVLKRWINNGVRVVGDLYTNNILSNFQQLTTKFNLCNRDLFKYLQVRHWIQEKSLDFPNIPNKSPLEDYMVNSLITSTKGLISFVYSALIKNLLIYDTMSFKQKWETDLGCVYDEIDWQNNLERSQSVIISTKHRQMQFNIFHRTYFTPLRLHKIDGTISAMCQRCKISEGSLVHMLWSCPYLEEYWKFVIATVSEVVGCDIPHDPRIWLLGDVNLFNVNFNKKYFVSLAGTAAKKVILVNWKSDKSPSQRHWLNELSSYCTPEKILYNVRRNPKMYDKIWGKYLDILPSITPHS